MLYFVVPHLCNFFSAFDFTSSLQQHNLTLNDLQVLLLLSCLLLWWRQTHKCLVNVTGSNSQFAWNIIRETQWPHLHRTVQRLRNTSQLHSADSYPTNCSAALFASVAFVADYMQSCQGVLREVHLLLGIVKPNTAAGTNASHDHVKP